MKKDTTPKRLCDLPEIQFIDKSNEATICENCHKPLTENSIRYVNGTGFCSKDCEEIYFNRTKYSVEIEDTIHNCIPLLYRNSDPDLIRNLLKFPKNLDRVLDWSLGQKGMAIIGNTGAGKTRALTLLIKKLVKKDLVGITTSLMVFYAGELERAIMSSFKKATEYDSFMRKLENCGLLIIDDFGKEKFTERYEVSVFQIFEKRFANLKPIIFTTNYRGEEFKARFSDMANYEPFSRRVNEFMERINFSKKD